MFKNVTNQFSCWRHNKLTEDNSEYNFYLIKQDEGHNCMLPDILNY